MQQIMHIQLPPNASSNETTLPNEILSPNGGTFEVPSFADRVETEISEEHENENEIESTNLKQSKLERFSDEKNGKFKLGSMRGKLVKLRSKSVAPNTVLSQNQFKTKDDWEGMKFETVDLPSVVGDGIDELSFVKLTEKRQSIPESSFSDYIQIAEQNESAQSQKVPSQRQTRPKNPLKDTAKLLLIGNGNWRKKVDIFGAESCSNSLKPASKLKRNEDDSQRTPTDIVIESRESIGTNRIAVQLIRLEKGLCDRGRNTVGRGNRSIFD